MSELTCFNCRYWAPSEPPQGQGWPKLERSDYYVSAGIPFDVYELTQYLSKHKLALRQPNGGYPGRCLFQPTPVEAKSQHTCGQHSVNKGMIQDWDRFSKRYGDHAETEELKKQLREARELARKRYHQLQALKGKRPKPKTNGAGSHEETHV